MAAEETQELGREGAFLFKRWLESTTYFDLPWIVYNQNGMCEVRFAEGPKGLKRFDLAGSWLQNPPIPVWVEGKRYTTDSGLKEMFLEMIAIAYAAYRYKKKNGSTDGGDQFIYATTHPFAVTSWTQLISTATIEEAYNKYPDIVRLIQKSSQPHKTPTPEPPQTPAHTRSAAAGNLYAKPATS